ncbi:MAG: hypothetical protein AABX82_09210 [Nanoarchaeota archaeon]
MNTLIKKTVALGFGISTLTQEQVNKFTKEVMKKQGVSEREAKKFTKSVIKKSQETQQKVNTLVTRAAESLFHAAGLATKKDIADLKKERKRKNKTKDK